MAALPSSPQTKFGNELNNVSSNEASKRRGNDGVKHEQFQSIQAVRKTSIERHPTTASQVPLPGTYYMQANEARGNHMVRYVFANLMDPNDESLPFHIREKYKEIQRERLRGYQQALSTRGTSPNKQYGIVDHYFSGNKLSRPASANYERKPQNIPNDSRARSGKNVTDIVTPLNSAKANQKVTPKNIQQTRSSNAVLAPKKNIRSRSKTSSPRPRRPFSIAAESTSDTDPIENQRGMESVRRRSPPRASGNRHLRQQQYLATKFKLAARNSKHTQTFVAAKPSVEDSSGSATTVVSRHHSTTQTEIDDKNVSKPTSIQPDLEINNKIEEKRMNNVTGDVDDKKLIIASQNVTKNEAVYSPLTEKGQESLEWKRAKLRLRSTPRSPSPPLPESQHRVASVDRVRLPSIQKSSCSAGDRAVSAQSGLASRVNPAPPAPERRFVSSATQIVDRHTTDAGVQVKLKKKRPPSERKARRERRSPSQRSVASKEASQSGSKGKVVIERTKKDKHKKETKSRDPSIRSLRSLRSFHSDASTGILKQVKIVNSSTSPAMLWDGRSASAAALRETKTKKKKSKVNMKKSSRKIARFLRTLSKDKEAINVISKMAAMQKKKTSK